MPMKRKLAGRLFRLIPPPTRKLILDWRRLRSLRNTRGINLNVGAGSREIPGFLSLDFYSEAYYGARATFDRKRIHYDINRDRLPYEDNVVSNIYISHVIEHVDDDAVKRFLSEARRVLRPGGVLRISCPDARFLFEISQFDNHYWSWRRPWVDDKANSTHGYEHYLPLDFFIAEIGTAACRFSPRSTSVGKSVKPEDLEGLPLEAACEKITRHLSFSSADPSLHINWFSFEKLESFGLEAEFRHVIHSKAKGSLSSVMRNREFDEKALVMSLYVDMVV